MRYVKYIFMFIFCLFIFPLNVHALTSSEYRDRNVCSNYEVAIAKEGKAGDPSSTYADTVGCYGTYNEAVNAMNANTNKDVIIFERNNGKTNIPGTDYGQWFYSMECLNCGHNYMANGTDIWLRKCPKCQGGKE